MNFDSLRYRRSIFTRTRIWQSESELVKIRTSKDAEINKLLRF
jgi:hypothetical protein